MGAYHQGGVVSAQSWLGQQQQQELGIKDVFWWRTYSPPVWLLGGKELSTTDLMGMKVQEMIERVSRTIGECEGSRPRSVGLVAPWSAVELDDWIEDSHLRKRLLFERVWMSKKHLNLDDIDFEGDGIRGTLSRVVGRRGLVIWKISRHCGDGR